MTFDTVSAQEAHMYSQLLSTHDAIFRTAQVFLCGCVFECGCGCQWVVMQLLIRRYNSHNWTQAVYMALCKCTCLINHIYVCVYIYSHIHIFLCSDVSSSLCIHSNLKHPSVSFTQFLTFGFLFLASGS